jgi:hypothetical protein
MIEDEIDRELHKEYDRLIPEEIMVLALLRKRLHKNHV